jgi:hypothetical protein
MIVSVVISASWQRATPPSLPGRSRPLGMGWPSGRVKPNPPPRAGDQPAEGVHDHMVASQSKIRSLSRVLPPFAHGIM